MKKRLVIALQFLVFASSAARADIIVPGADGSDGAFSPVSNTTINLANSPDGSWDGMNPDAGTPLTGVYDAEKWAVVFRYSSVNIPANVTVTFSNHPSRAPVVWLVSGNVTISGTIAVNGAIGHAAGATIPAAPGPGGFRGGFGKLSAGSPQSAGFGPGGNHNLANDQDAAGACHAFSGGGGASNGLGSTYGNVSLLPLVGGSGGGGDMLSSSDNRTLTRGGAGGGAILIAATGTITVNGAITAKGGNPGCQANCCATNDHCSAGSGGAIRLVGNQVRQDVAGAVLSALGGSSPCTFFGGAGRIRIETNLDTNGLEGIPPASFGIPGSAATIWPLESDPTIEILSVDGHEAPLDPRASLNPPAGDINITNPNPVEVILACTNVPMNAALTVRVIPKRGQDIVATATFLSGDLSSSLWITTVQFTNGFSAIQAKVVVP